MALPWEAGTFWNVHFSPDLLPEEPDPEVVFCPLDSSPLPLNYRVEADQVVYWETIKGERKPGSDVDVCFGGRIAVTLIRVF